ncbi:MAG: hypothetical protein DMD62_06910 [Gemmatimonadetes bacterium]|nr:MAG: hypothetical protein DMD62_06910 [Gemmatimonadota bacterium]
MRLAWLAAASLVLSAPGRLAAQSPTLTVTLQSTLPRVRSTGLLADGKFVGLMRSGFPLRLHYRLELWRVRGSWFDQFIREISWDAVARNDPLADDFVLIRQGGEVTRYATPDELEAALDIPYTVTLRPSGSSSARYYFVARLEVTTLNDTDLQELSRWLSGDVGPAVSGEGNFGDALARGAQRVLVRLAGLPRQRLEARSPTFRTDGQ